MSEQTFLNKSAMSVSTSGMMTSFSCVFFPEAGISDIFTLKILKRSCVCAFPGRTVMGRSRKSYFSEAQNDGERSGLLSSASQDAITEAASNFGSPRGQYEGVGRTLTPHSLSAPAGLDSAAWDESLTSRPDSTQEYERTNQTNEPDEADLIVIS